MKFRIEQPTEDQSEVSKALKAGKKVILHDVPHVIEVSRFGGHVTVKVNGHAVIDPQAARALAWLLIHAACEADGIEAEAAE